MQRQKFHRAALASLAGALIAAPSAIAAEISPAIAGWSAVPDDVLAALRGGLDIGQLTANFAIEREVLIDGQLVAKTFIVFSGLGELARGRLPDVQVLGDLATRIRVEQSTLMPNSETVAAAAVAAANAAMNLPASEAARGAMTEAARSAGRIGAAATAQSNPAPANQPAAAAAPANPASASAPAGNSGVTSTSNIASGATPHFGDALERAVNTVTGGSSPSSPPAPVAAAAAAARQARSPAPAQNAAAPAASATMTTQMIIPVGNTGQVIVISNIPNAAALMTSIQNMAQGTTIDTRTTINASVEGSLSSLRSGALAASIREQAMRAIGR